AVPHDRPARPDDGPAQRPSGDHGRIPRPGRSRREQPVLGGDQGLPHQPPRRVDRAVGGPPRAAPGSRRTERPALLPKRPPSSPAGGRSLSSTSLAGYLTRRHRLALARIVL